MSFRRRQLHQAKPILGLIFGLCLLGTASAQTYPDKIRGYKVHDGKVNVRTRNGNSSPTGSSAEIVLGAPKLFDGGLAGITFEVGAEVTSSEHSGKVDFLTFSDFRVNGIAVDVAEYTTKFKFKKGERILLPHGPRVTISTLNLARAARNELLDPVKKWRLNGTVFVFGKFKRFGFSFKRVVPIEIDVLVDNPVRK